MSALIVDEIAGYRRIEALINLVLITLALNIIVGLLSALAARLDKITTEKLNLGNLTSNLNKTLDSDFEPLENGEIMGVAWEIWQASRINGLGIQAMLRSSKAFADNVINIILAIGGMSSIVFIMITSQVIGYVWLFFLLALIVLFIYISFKNAKTLTRLGEEIMVEGKRQNAVSDKFNEISAYQAGKDYRIYDMKQIINEYRQKKVDMIKRHNFKYSRGLRNAQIPEAVISAAINFSIYTFVGVNALAGIFGIGSVVLYVGFIHRFVAAVKDMAANVSMFKMNNVFLTNFLDYHQNNKTAHHGTLPVKASDYEIEFHNVSYKYRGAEHHALKNINFKLSASKKLAVVGINGSGKTTMIKLLCRLYDPTEGKITLNGIDIREYDFDEYMALFSVVFQDFQLFAFSLGQNISASADYDAVRAEQALLMAGFEERLNEMSKKLETPLYKDFEEDGVEISGGEAQKIALARALYKDAPFIILDEPTAALDPFAEFEIYTRFNEIVENKTAIYISHRLSSCRFCDDIIVFDEGEIIQRGNHDMLILDENKKYYALWNAQAQYYIEK